MFNFLKNTLQHIYTQFTSRLSSLLGLSKLDEKSALELEKILISADTGVHTTQNIITQLKQHTGDTPLRTALKPILVNVLNKPTPAPQNPDIIILVGINGSGKTTTAGKLAHHFATQHQRVTLVAADTFRAAATEQLNAWAQHNNITCIQGTPGQDPASLVYEGCAYVKNNPSTKLIIDTAGRLQTKKNLMNELAKIRRVIEKHLPEKTIATFLVLDAMLGQNSFEQARVFAECTPIDGIILSKMDGTGKGGIVFAIADQLAIPVTYFTYGEQIHQISFFSPETYVDQLLPT